MKKFLPILILIFLSLPYSALSQPGCPGVNAGPDLTVDCFNNCTNLNATFHATGSSNSYSVSSIAYNPPYPYNSGTPIIANTDDVWSGVISLPFNFCYYGNMYSEIVAGSNGCISFNTGYANGYCPWSFSVNCPDPSIPVNAIFGPYHDIDPGVGGALYYAILGSYPCRTFVINFFNVPMFQCNSLIATHQIVLYESTNVIEVYIQDKPLCGSWNSGNAVVGIQDATGTNGLTAPGRQTGQWTATNEAWRFTPNGTPNYVLSWYNGAQLLGNGTSISVCPTATTTYTAEVIYTNCDGSVITVNDSVTVNFNNNLNVSVSPNPVSFCTGGSAGLTASGAVNYSWSPATGLSSSTGSNVTAGPFNTTVYTVTGSTTVCTDTTTVTVTVNPGPSVTISPASPATCPGVATPLSAVSSVPGTTYTWSNGASGASILVSPVVPTTYIVTGTDPGGCIGTDTVLVSMLNGGGLAVSPQNPSVCAGTPVVLTASGASTYAWSPANGLSGTTGPVVTAAPLNSTVYMVIGVSSQGCIDTVLVPFTVIPPPAISAGPDTVSCGGGSGQLQGSGGLIYQWSPATGLSSTTVADPVASPPVTTTYYLNAFAANGSVITNGDFSAGNTGFSTDYVYSSNLQPQGYYYISPNPNLNHPGFSACPDHTTGTGNMMVVNGADVPNESVWCQTVYVTPNTSYAFSCWLQSVHATSPALLQFSINGVLLGAPFMASATTCVWDQFYSVWNSDSNTSAQICIVNQNTASSGNDFALDDISFSPLCPGADTVVVQVSYITATTSGTDVNCNSGSDGNATATPLSGIGPFSYQWNTSPPQTTQTATGLSTGTYMVTVTDAAGCSAFDTIDISEPPPLIASLDTTTIVSCYGGNNGTAEASASGGTPPYTYLWSNGAGGPAATGFTAGVHHVTVTDAHNCPATAQFNIMQNPLITIFLEEDDETCLNACDGQVTAWVQGGRPPYQYVWSNSQTGSQISGLCPGIYTVAVTDSLNCPQTAAVSISTHAFINIGAVVDPQTGIAPAPFIFTYTGSGAINFLWDFGDGTTSGLQNPTHTYADPGTYTVTLTANTGPPGFCEDVVTVTVIVYPPSHINIPNVFTPNGDGANDEFIVESEGLDAEQMIIYNRWGKKVFEWNTLHGKWDGTKEGGAESADGVYYYIFTAKGFDGIDYIRNGTVNLLR